MPNFKDNFSKQSDIYLKYRPHYPKALYSYLASLTPAHELAWDCGTGNGQAAIGLADFYDKIIATDPSEQQIGNSIPNEKVNYIIEKAENTSIAAHSVDLVTIANALHWFDFDLFYQEAKRVLKPNGIIAAWLYRMPSISPDIDKVLTEFHDGVINDYWQAENRLVEKKYSTIPFPFEVIDSPNFYSEKMMNRNDFIAFLNTWSAVQRFIQQNGYNPVEAFEKDLCKVWEDANIERKVVWELTLKVGKMVPN